MSRVARVYTLPRCDVSLFATASPGVLGALVWQGKQVDNLRIGERFDEAERFYTGIPYPDTHHLAARHEISFDAVWNVPARMQRNVEYIMAVTWLDATLGTTTNGYVRRFYNGVMTSSRDVASRDANEFGSGNTLKAKYYTEVEGDGDPVELAPGLETC